MTRQVAGRPSGKKNSIPRPDRNTWAAPASSPSASTSASTNVCGYALPAKLIPDCRRTPSFRSSSSPRPRRHGDTRPLGDGLAGYLGLGDSATRVIERSLPVASDVLSALGWFGLLLLLASATAFSRALDRFYARVWSTRRPGLRGAWRWVAVLAAILLGLAVIQFTRSILRSEGGYVVLTISAEFVLWTLIWLAAGWIILNRAVSIRALLPGAMLCGVGLAVTGSLGRIYLPIALTSAAEQFGALGITIAYIGWLFILMFVVVVGVTVGQVLTNDYGLFAGARTVLNGPS
ncbi:hypothetical protein E3O23_02895 [Cryobacterium tagatosivorans]|uniref:YihY/virulence factor BrkB family protein n=1 Tax=Cryobacterium tagatosivorans TaxID=1259199 RepID=A0A4R8UGW7_9MICO|nr:hypothetical protein E3O23_02895 [Cryobacterium tagatosivorans]